jgi:hypothetical protein
MKKILIIVAMIMFSGCTSVTNRMVPKKISDSYATTALLALKAIQRDPFVPKKNSQLVSRFTQDKIDAADVVAVSNEERNLTNALNPAYHAQLILNKLIAKSDARWAKADADKPSGVPSRSCHEAQGAKIERHPAWDKYCAALVDMDNLLSLA